MYKALIADDEEIIRRGLAKLLSADPEIQVVAQAEDGQDALGLAQAHSPDLLLVDINMPFLGGLEFIEQVSGMLPGAVIIVITGYDDFAYTQKALRLKVFDYLLKPIMEETFYPSILRAKQQLVRNQQQMKYLKCARTQLDKNRSALTASFLEGWLCGRYSDPEIQEHLEYLSIEIPEPYGITVAHLSVNQVRSSIGREWDENLLYYAAENIARELFEPLGPVASCNTGGDLVLFSSCMPQQAWNEAGEALGRLLEQYLPVQVTLRQECGRALAELPETYDAAREELSCLIKCPPAVTEARRYIEANYADENLTLQAAAEALHLSPQHLSRMFHHETGITFVDYLTKVRIRRATELLSEGDMKMYEIAGAVGYASQHYFSCAFKKILGVPPMEYRKNERDR